MFQANQRLHDRYQLQKRLGRTAAGRQTWLAHDRAQSDRPVVVKLLVFDPEFQWDNLKLFEREAQVLANLNHPQIPQYIDFFVADTADQATLHWWALVQEFVPGDSLQDLIDRRYRFAPDEIRDLALELLEILTYLHELSPPVLHRDIKPSNLILGEDNKIYLIDFGAVQDQSKVTGMTFTVVGTVGYAPMEQFWGRSTPASDLYGLGATLIHLITGIPPADLPQSDLRLQFADRMSHTSIAANWLSKMVEPAIEKRYQSARSACVDLLNGVKATSQLVRPESCSMQIAIDGEDLVIWPSARTRLTPPVSHKRKLKQNEYWAGWILAVVFITTVCSVIAGVIPNELLMLTYYAAACSAIALTAIIMSTTTLITSSRYGLRFSGRTFAMIPNTTASKQPSYRRKPLTIALVNTIQTVSARDAMAYAAQPSPAYDYWQVVIQAKERHILPWKLSESESRWIVQEIQQWLDRSAQGQNK